MSNPKNPPISIEELGTIRQAKSADTISIGIDRANKDVYLRLDFGDGPAFLVLSLSASHELTGLLIFANEQLEVD